MQLREEIAKCLFKLNIGFFNWRRDAIIHKCASFVSGVISHLLSRYELTRLDSRVQYNNLKILSEIPDSLLSFIQPLLRSTLGERFVIFGDPVVDGIPVHARREDSRFLVTWTGDVQNLRHFE